MPTRRSRRNEPDLLVDIFTILKHLPIWVGPILAMLVFAVFRWAVPGLMSLTTSEAPHGEVVPGVLSGVAISVAPFAGAIVLMLWVAAEVWKFTQRRRLERQSGAGSVAALGWHEFEALLAEAFRRQGFLLARAQNLGPDGGIDLRLEKAGAVTLVQCKHWKAARVGVRVVRELLGVVSGERAQSGIVVTSGEFTPDAVEFAARTPIRLIGGEELIAMLGEVQHSGRIYAETEKAASARPASGASTQAHPQPGCPQCGAAMVRRVAKKGPHAGTAFLGCSRYPQCRGTRGLDTALRGT